jgi:hypothetical protein
LKITKEDVEAEKFGIDSNLHQLISFFDRFFFAYSNQIDVAEKYVENHEGKLKFSFEMSRLQSKYNR